MPMRISGVDKVQVNLRQISERTTRKSRRVIEEEGYKLRDEARLNAPVDTGNLEQAIRVEVRYEGRYRRKVVEVGVDLDEAPYAIFMHEGWEGHPTYNLGPRSRRKAEALNRIVGRKYLERAATDREESILQRVGQAIAGELT